MRYFHKTQQKFYCPIINVDKLWSLFKDEVSVLAACTPTLPLLLYTSLTLLFSPCLPLLLNIPQERDQLLKSATEKNAPVLDCVAHGYYKVLGNGRLPEVPLIVKAKFFSHLAEKKIKAAGGVCVTVA